MEPLRVPASPALRAWSQQQGFSPELVARWGAFYGDLPELMAAMRRPAPTYLRLNPLRGDGRETLERLQEKGFRLSHSGIEGTWRVDEAPISPGATDEYLLGRYYLQDASSALAPLALDPRPGERVADLCAAPGGKTIGLAGLTADQAAILACDAEERRAVGLRANLARCGVRNVALHIGPAQALARVGPTFDAVLLDAPCTGEGVVQRDPGRRKGHLGEYAACAREQADLVRTAHALLRPGGRLLYSTCTLAPEENELQVAAAIASGLFELEPLPESVSRVRLGGHPLRPGLRDLPGHSLPAELERTAHVLPHPHGVLGFYLALLRKVPA